VLRKPPSSDYRIELFASQAAVAEQHVIDLWVREGALNLPEARRRASEVLLVATDGNQHLAAVSTAFLGHSEQLRTDMWYTRVFVAEAHRRSHVAAALAQRARDHLARQFADGADRRATGMIFEVASEVLKRFRPQAVWPYTDFVFVGENARGDHVRVYYFPGALAPDPG
jgi:hypothetical protein